MLAGPLGGGERYRFASAMSFRRLVYGSSGSSQSCLDHAAVEGAYRHSLALAAQPKLSHTFTARSPPTPTPPPSTTQPPPFLMNQSPGFGCMVFLTIAAKYTLIQGCESTDKSMNRDRGTRTRIGSGASFFWVSLSNLVIDDNFRISNNLGPVLAANISAALAIQPVRDREIEIIL